MLDRRRILGAFPNSLSGERSLHLSIRAALLLLTIFFFDVSPSAAQQCLPNGCGPQGFFNYVVPNRIAHCKFKDACDAHDICYSECLSCSPTWQRAVCSGAENKKKRKIACDVNFRDKLTEQNKGSRICAAFVRAYYLAVVSMGESWHRGKPPDDEAAEQFKATFEDEMAEAGLPITLRPK